MRRTAPIAALSLLVLAAGPAPSGSFIPSAPPPTYRAPPQNLTTTAPANPGYDAAPMPNQDQYAPTSRASNATTISPNVFRRKEQYQGDAIDPSSSVQSQQTRKTSPGGGFSLSVPLQ